MKDALALTGEEGRGKLRKASVSRTQALLTGDIRKEKSMQSNICIFKTESIGFEGETQGSETS